MTLFVLFVKGEVYATDRSEWELRDTVYKMDLDRDGTDWEIVRYEPADTVASAPKRSGA